MVTVQVIVTNTTWGGVQLPCGQWMFANGVYSYQGLNYYLTNAVVTVDGAALVVMDVGLQPGQVIQAGLAGFASAFLTVGAFMMLRYVVRTFLGIGGVVVQPGE